MAKFVAADGFERHVYSTKQTVSTVPNEKRQREKEREREREEKKEKKRSGKKKWRLDGWIGGDPRLSNVFIVDANFLHLSEAR